MQSMRDFGIMALKIQIAVLLVVACVNGNMDDNPGCSKEWIKYLIVNACNYSKRSAILISYILEDSIEDMTDKFYKILSPIEWEPISRAKNSDGKPTPDSDRGNWKEPLNNLIGASGELSEEMLQELKNWERKRRSIKNLIEKCCQQLCVVDDFKGLCFA